MNKKTLYTFQKFLLFFKKQLLFSYFEKPNAFQLYTYK